MLEYDSNLICVPESQMFNWKTAKHFWNDELLNKMKNYQLIGPKSRQIKPYHTLNYVEKLLKDITLEELVKYNMCFTVIFKWLKVVIENRKKNIVSRLNRSKIAREEREKKIEEENARLEERANKLKEEVEKFENEHEDEIKKYNEY